MVTETDLGGLAVAMVPPKSEKKIIIIINKKLAEKKIIK
jgi:hypothetical protein